LYIYNIMLSRSLLFGLLGLANAISTNITSIDVNIVSDLCNPVIPYCDGAWLCTNPNSTAIYHHRYGMICRMDDVALTSDMCPFGGYIGNDGLCTLVKPASSMGCPDFTEIIRTADGISCLYKYPVICPKGYLYFQEYKSCLRFEPAICGKNSTDCGKYVCEGDVIPRYYDRYSTTKPICVYQKYPAPANDAGYLVCNPEEVLVDKYCVVFTEARYVACSPTPFAPSIVPYPTREAASQSSYPNRESVTQSAYPTREAPSQSSYPNRESVSSTPYPIKESVTQTPCIKWMCENGIVPTYTSLTQYPVCIYSKYDAPANSTGYLNCPNGGTLIGKVCYIYTEAIAVPCDTIIDTYSVTPSLTPSNTAKYDRVSSSPTPTFTNKLSPLSTVTPSMTAKINNQIISSSPSMTAKYDIQTPSPSMTGKYDRMTPSSSITQRIVDSSNPCDKYMCLNGMAVEYITERAVCVYKRYAAVANADGILVCKEGGTLVNGECIIFDAAIYMACTPSPTVTVKQQEKPSPSPIRVSTVSASITIEVRLDTIPVMSDLSIFKDETMLLSLKEAIAKVLNVAVDTIVIESLSWVENGNIKSIVSLLNSTVVGGRLLQAVNSLNINYKVINATEDLMGLSAENYAVLIGSSSEIVKAAASVVSLATGVEVLQDAITVQSSLVTTSSVSQPDTTGSSYGMIGGIVAGVAFVVGASVLVVVKRRARKQTSKIAKRYGPDNARVDSVTIVNPVSDGTSGYKSNMFKPQPFMNVV
jgi:hypothetical protein